MKWFKFLFAINKKPLRGLLAVEWVVLGYTGLTLLVMLFMWTKVINPHVMLSLRLQSTCLILALWVVYRLVPCRMTLFCRIALLMLMLAQWYPDTYEFNRLLPNLDHLFAAAKQQLCGFQPALVFADKFNHPVFSELMHLSYVSYFPLIASVTLFYFFWRNDDFLRAMFIIITSFFTFYTVFIFLPVVGPQYYYPAVGIDLIARGEFPALGDYFMAPQQLPVMPGWEDGIFYKMNTLPHTNGECSTAAFPSSHVGVTLILLLLAWRTGNRKLTVLVAIFFTLMLFATVYVKAHYAIDVLAGIVSGFAFYFLLLFVYNRFVSR